MSRDSEFDSGRTHASAPARLEEHSQRPLYLQLAAILRHRIVDEPESPMGTPMPSAHQLAAAFGVNVNTALRALRTLRSEGLIDFRRGRPVTVNSAVPRAAFAVLDEQARALFEHALSIGFSRQHLIAILDDVVASDSR